MEPVLAELAAEYPAISVAKLNVDENPATATRFDVLSIPTLLAFKDGSVVKKLVGAMPRSGLSTSLQTGSARTGGAQRSARAAGSPHRGATGALE